MLLLTFTALSPDFLVAQPCDFVRFKSEVEVSGTFTMANLLQDNSCPEIVTAASGVALGHAPLQGSPRVFTDIEVRQLLEKILAENSDWDRTADPYVPQRITVRGRGLAVCCRTVSTASGLARHEKPPKLASLRDPELSVRAGQRVSLLWEHGGIRMVVPVICLESAGAGDRVQVQLLISRRSIPAIVMDGNTVRSNF